MHIRKILIPLATLAALTSCAVARQIEEVQTDLGFRETVVVVPCDNGCNPPPESLPVLPRPECDNGCVPPTDPPPFHPHVGPDNEGERS